MMGNDARGCKNVQYAFFNNAILFTEVAIGIFGFQLLLGTVFIAYYGIFTAAAEAAHLLVIASPEEETETERLITGK